MRHRERDGVRGAVHAVAGVGVAGEPLRPVGDDGVQIPPAAQRRGPRHLRPALEDAPQPEEVVVAPERQQDDERGDLLHERSGPAVPREPVGEPRLHEVDPIDEAAPGREAGCGAEQLEVIAIVAAGAVGERHRPELARPRAVRIARPRAHELRLGEPDLLPHRHGVAAEHAVVVVAIDAVGVHEAGGRARPQVPSQPQQVVDRIAPGGGLGVVVHGAEVGDRRAAHLARELRSRDGLHDLPRIDQPVRRVELLEPLEEKRPLLRIEQREALVDRHLADVGLDL